MENFRYFSEDPSSIKRSPELPALYPTPNKYISTIFDGQPLTKLLTTKQADYGGYKEKQKLQDEKVLERGKIPPKITKSRGFSLNFLNKTCR